MTRDNAALQTAIIRTDRCLETHRMGKESEHVVHFLLFRASRYMSQHEIGSGYLDSQIRIALGSPLNSLSERVFRVLCLDGLK
jgi:hypothetical protein